jgi:hypothetical protein
VVEVVTARIDSRLDGAPVADGMAVRPALCLLAIVLLATPGRADVRLHASFGGGIEGGYSGPSPSPTGVGEVGLAGEWLHREHGIGVGLAFQTIARPGVDLATYEEDVLDLALRARIGRSRFGIGGGLRFMKPDAMQPTIWGVDFLRIDFSTPLLRTSYRGVAGGIDAYVAFNFGCYMGRTERVTIADELSEVTCAKYMTTTYVAGLQFAIADR